MDLLGQTPLFDLRNDRWPILSDSYDGPMASLVRTRVDEAMIGQGSQIVDAEIRRSVIGREVIIEAGAHLEGCVIADGVHIAAGAKLRRVVADRFSKVPSRVELGYGASIDLERYHVSPSGLVVLPRNYAFRSALTDMTASVKP
jgi:glucose-1-phosphate adenylyltransferase